ncbi:type VI secretion system tube protein TssD [Tannerella sp.]|uniref:type VI secretion system tube protein TssD n=1 Tax=Tannerella sp. TaxID=2382127 RepID=UPI003FA27A93
MCIGNAILKQNADGSIPTHVYTDKFELESFSYSFDHRIDRDGKVADAGVPMGGSINAVYAGIPNAPLMKWGFGKHELRCGKIYVAADGGEPVAGDTITFDCAACVHMHINYTRYGDRYTTIRFVIQAENIRTEGGEWIEEWNDNIKY